MTKSNLKLAKEIQWNTDIGVDDKINHPKHYADRKVEPIDVIEDWNLNFNLGNVIKYVARCDLKGSPIDDLNKAVWYLNREIERRNKNE